MSLADRLKRKAAAAAQQKAAKPNPKAQVNSKPSTDPIFEALEATRASLRQLESAIIDYTAKE